MRLCYLPAICFSCCSIIQSKQELEDRIYLYFNEVNKEPVVYHWTYKLDEISQEEAQAAGVKSNQDIASR